jgi:hypothetical protein
MRAAGDGRYQQSDWTRPRSPQVQSTCGFPAGGRPVIVVLALLSPITAGGAVATPYASLPNLLVSAADGIDYAYRDAGEGDVPLVLFQHFRGELDNWDPALIDALATRQRVVTFDKRRRRRFHRINAARHRAHGI